MKLTRYNFISPPNYANFCIVKYARLLLNVDISVNITCNISELKSVSRYIQRNLSSCRSNTVDSICLVNILIMKFNGVCLDQLSINTPQLLKCHIIGYTSPFVKITH